MLQTEQITYWISMCSIWEVKVIYFLLVSKYSDGWSIKQYSVVIINFFVHGKWLQVFQNINITSRMMSNDDNINGTLYSSLDAVKV